MSREKKQQAKGRHRGKGESDDDIPSNDEHAEKEDFFKHEDNAFDDPFFKARLVPISSSIFPFLPSFFPGINSTYNR